tara:strand:- start:10034 stop:11326 length:1293 start_codon:yes stop_codon:yes gene_type:complete
MFTVLIVAVVVVVLALSGVMTGVAMIIAGALGLWLSFGDQAWNQIGVSVWASANSGTLAAIPLFVLMGEILSTSRAGSDLFNWLTRVGRRVPASSALGTVVVGAMISCVAGSLAAVTSIVTRTTYPRLRKSGLPVDQSLGLVASVGALGIMLPPSVTLIIFGSLTETAISDLFAAAILPGIIQIFLFAAMAVWAWKRAARKHPAPMEAPGQEQGRQPERDTIGAAWQFPVAILVVLGGFLAGWVTPVEAAALGATLALIMTLINGEISWLRLRSATRRTIVSTAMIMFILVGAQMLSTTLAFQGFGRDATQFIEALPVSPLVILMLIALFYVVLGILFDGLSMLVLTLPFVFPAIVGLGYDPIWLGVVLVTCVQIAELSPPVGVNLFVAQHLTKEPIEAVWRGVIPYMGMLCIMLVLLLVFPQIVTSFAS